MSKLVKDNDSDPEFHSFVLEHDEVNPNYFDTLESQDQIDEYFKKLSIQFYSFKRPSEK